VAHDVVPALGKGVVAGVVPVWVATALFWVGMEVVCSFTFSSTVISGDQKYGPIGVVFALMSWLIAIGVVIILGAVAGLVWRERGQSISLALLRFTRRSPPRPDLWSSRPNGDPDVLLRESDCRLAEVN
jgi:uncharacterized BrkB/YihY/UPF0761 family membrane protein